MIDLEKLVRNIPDFPKPGIQFKDITPILASHHAFSQAIAQMAAPFKNKGIQKVIGIEARGFLFASAIALEIGAGLIPVRKPGKLPYQTVSYTYDLEYGTDTIEIHDDAVLPNERILIVDDLLATGGTMQAACKLVEKLQGTVAGISFLIELAFLKGREKINNYQVFSLIQF